MAVLTACAIANMEALGGMAPDLVGLNKTATEAMQTASRQVSAVVDELRKRIADLQAETQQAMGATKESSADLQRTQLFSAWAAPSIAATSAATDDIWGVLGFPGPESGALPAFEAAGSPLWH